MLTASTTAVGAVPRSVEVGFEGSRLITLANIDEVCTFAPATLRP